VFLVLGPGGQIGWELRRALQPLGLVRPAGRAASGGLPGLDLADPDSVRAVVRLAEPDVIVNAAAYTAVDAAEAAEELAARINAAAPAVLAEEAARCGAALVHYSTDYVFDGSGESPWREDDETGPLSAYGRTKLAGEEAVRAAGAAHLILRVSWVYGLRGRNFLASMLGAGAVQPELAVVADQYGAPTPARSVADATAAVLAQCGRDPAAGLTDRGGTYHLCCDGVTTWHGFAETIFAEARRRGRALAVREVRPVRAADRAAAAVRPANSRLECRRIAAEFGVALPHWRESLGLCLDDLLGEPVGQDVASASPERRVPGETPAGE
jgi:dTDP-4-dehydrorhamnose reductase